MTASGSPDAIVVGAGLGGLTTAACLAVCGARVVVLEQHTVAGGNSQVFRRKGAYEFDVGVHYIGDGGPSGPVQSIFRGLGADGRVAFRQLDPDCFDRIVLPTVDLRVPCGWEAYRERVARALPAEADGVRTFADVCAAVWARQRGAASPGAHTGPHTGPHTGAPRDTGAAPGTAGGRLAALAPRWRTMTLGGLMDQCGLSPRARTVLAGQIVNLGLPPAEVSLPVHAAMLGDYLAGAYYPAGGGQMLAATLTEALTAHGGELRTRTGVRRILTERNAVTGVELADGSVVRAPVVISNADYRRTMLELIGPERLPTAVAARAERATMALPMAVLYLAIDGDAPPPPASNLWWYESEHIDELFAEMAAGELDRARFAFISSGSAKDAGGPQAGRGTGRHRVPHHTVEVMTICPGSGRWAVPGDAPAYSYRADPGYQDDKRRIGASLLDLAERALGPLRDHVLHREIAMPQTQARFTWSTGGTSYGLASTPHQYGPLRPGYRTAVAGLYMVGASTRTGFGVTAVMTGGVRCAEGVLGRPLLAGMRGGTVFGRPELIAPRPRGWDPLLASRGARVAAGSRR